MPVASDEMTRALGSRHPESGPFSPADESEWGHAAYPLGAHVHGRQATFAVCSRHATRVLLEIYAAPMGEAAAHEYWMVKGADHVWRAKLEAVPEGSYYGFRCWGPNWDFTPDWRRGNSAQGFLADVDDQGNRFNPNKLLFDPYAREFSHDRE